MLRWPRASHVNVFEEGSAWWKFWTALKNAQGTVVRGWLTFGTHQHLAQYPGGPHTQILGLIPSSRDYMGCYPITLHTKVGDWYMALVWVPTNLPIPLHSNTLFWLTWALTRHRGHIHISTWFSSHMFSINFTAIFWWLGQHIICIFQFSASVFQGF